MKDRTHRVHVVTFEPGTNDGPLECTCTDAMLASQFAEHRRANGQSDTRLRALPEYDLVPEYVKRSRKRGGAAYALMRKSRELFTGCEPTGEAGLPCRNCGRLLMLGKQACDGQRLQHAPMKGLARR